MENSEISQLAEDALAVLNENGDKQFNELNEGDQETVRIFLSSGKPFHDGATLANYALLQSKYPEAMKQ